MNTLPRLRPDNPMPSTPHARAALLMIGSTLFFGAMAVTIRLASETLSTYVIAFFRNFFGLIALLPFLWRSGPAVLRPPQLPRYLVRSAIGVGSMLCGFWAIGNLPIATAIALAYSETLSGTHAAALLLPENGHTRHQGPPRR